MVAIEIDAKQVDAYLRLAGTCIALGNVESVIQVLTDTLEVLDDPGVIYAVEDKLTELTTGAGYELDLDLQPDLSNDNELEEKAYLVAHLGKTVGDVVQNLVFSRLISLYSVIKLHFFSFCPFFWECLTFSCIL